MSAKKQFGQNFLQNKKKLLKMVEVLDSSLDVIIEIGPGHGELTRYILERGFSVICIEKDRDLIPILEKNFSKEISQGRLTLVMGDALEELKADNKKLLITEKDKKSYAIVGNIPYYITGHLLRIIGELKYKPKQVVLLVQEEVALRVCAQKGDMNLFAASVGWWASARVVTRVSRSMFSPPPHVDSAVIVLTEHTPCILTTLDSIEKYFLCMKAIFKQPRRMVIRNLIDVGITRERAENVLIQMQMPLTVRPQDFSVEEIAALSVLFDVL